MKKIKWLLVAIFCLVLSMGMSVGADVTYIGKPVVTDLEVVDGDSDCYNSNGLKISKLVTTGDTVYFHCKIQSQNPIVNVSLGYYHPPYANGEFSDVIHFQYDPSNGYYVGKIQFTDQMPEGNYQFITALNVVDSKGLVPDQTIWMNDIILYNKSCASGNHTVDINSPTKIENPTCTSAGKEYKTCVICGHLVPETVKNIPAIGHTLETIKYDPSCTTPGKNIQKCSICNTIVSETSIPALGHNYTWETSTQSNAFDGNIRTQRCLTCGATGKTESLPYTVKPRILKIGGDVFIHASDFGASGSQYKLAKYRSSNSKVATVSKKGKVVAKKIGTCYIQVTTKNGKTARIKIQVKPTNTRKISFTKKLVTLKKGKTFTLKYKRYPAKANDKLTWKSSKPKIVKVTSKGKVKALKKGKSTITVKAASGKSAKITIRVK